MALIAQTFTKSIQSKIQIFCLCAQKSYFQVFQTELKIMFPLKLNFILALIMILSF